MEIWCACQWLGIRPPGVAPAWDDNGAQVQANILECYRRHVHDKSTWEASLANAKVT